MDLIGSRLNPQALTGGALRADRQGSGLTAEGPSDLQTLTRLGRVTRSPGSTPAVAAPMQNGHDVTTRGAQPLVHEVARIVDVREKLGPPDEVTTRPV